MLSALLTTLLVLVSIVLILLIVALQHGNEGGIGSAFGSGNSSGFFGATGGVALIIRATWIVGTLFFLLSGALAWVKTNEQYGVGREIERDLLLQTPAPGTAPGAAVSPGATPGAAVSPGATPGVDATPDTVGTAAPSGTVTPTPAPTVLLP